MIVDEEFEGGGPDEGPVDTLEACFEAHGWSFERVSDDEIVATVQGSWTQYELRAVWRESDRVLQFLALPDIRVAADQRPRVYETIGLVNEQLWLGHFDVWIHEGLIMFRQGLMLNGALATPGQCEALLKAALEACERYYQAFQFVVWAGKESREALASTMFETEGRA